MSQIAVVEHYWTGPNCDYVVTWATQYLVLFYGAHMYIAVLSAFESIVRTKELYLLLLSLGIALNYWLNILIQWFILQPVPQPLCGVLAIYCIDSASPFNACGVPPWPSPTPAGATCGALPLPPCDPCVPCGMPATEPHLSGFVVVSIGVFAMQWRSPHIHMYQTAIVVFFYSLVVYSHVYIGFNDPAQVLAGVFIGAVAGLFWHFFVFWAAYPSFDRVLRWPLVRFMGYRDTFCRSYHPVPGDPAPIDVDNGYLATVLGADTVEAYPSNAELRDMLHYESLPASKKRA